MVKNSTLRQDDAFEIAGQSHAPKSSTTSLIRQFARAYTVIAGVSLNQMLIN